jgi:hypothetical protein
MTGRIDMKRKARCLVLGLATFFAAADLPVGVRVGEACAKRLS